MIIHGRVWKIGDDLGGKDILSPDYDPDVMSKKFDICVQHLLEDVLPDFSANYQAGDIIVAGTNLGLGHAHYAANALQACLAADLGGFVAESVNTIFQRASIDFGFVSVAMPGISSMADTGDVVDIDLENGKLENLTTGNSYDVAPVPDVILDILEAGGSDNWALRAVGRADLIKA